MLFLFSCILGIFFVRLLMQDHSRVNLSILIGQWMLVHFLQQHGCDSDAVYILNDT